MVNLRKIFKKFWRSNNKYYKNYIIVGDLDDIKFEDEIKKNNFILFGIEKFKWLYFKCPCRCENTIQLNLMRTISPKWKVSINRDKTINIYPSVINTKCNSHFWVNKNRVT